MFLNYASYFAAPQNELRSIVDFILGQKMSDGGFNCDSNIRHPHHSSLHTSVSVLEGFQQFLDEGYAYRAGDIADAIANAQEFILMHRFFRSDRTGKIIDPAFLRWPYPFRWKYNVLRALDHFATARVAYDPRMRESVGPRDRETPPGRSLAGLCRLSRQAALRYGGGGQAVAPDHVDREPRAAHVLRLNKARPYCPVTSRPLRFAPVRRI